MYSEIDAHPDLANSVHTIRVYVKHNHDQMLALTRYDFLQTRKPVLKV